MNHPELIGIAGTFASGKDTVTRHLMNDFGYHHVSTSDLVREAAQRERGSVERDVLYNVADEHRKREGAGIFVERALASPRPLVVTGLRSLGEAKAIKAAGGVLLFIDAPIGHRYEWMKGRNRDEEVELTLEQFTQREASEWHAGEEDSDFNLGGIKEMADIVCDNAGTVDDLVDEVYQRLGLKTV